MGRSRAAVSPARTRSGVGASRPLALALTVILTVALASVARWTPTGAATIAREGGPLESTQAVLFAASAVLAGRRAIRLRARGQAAAVEVLLACLFFSIMSGELDLDLRSFGVRVVHTKFFVNPAVWLPYRVLAALVLGTFYAGLGVYALRHRGAIWRAGLRMPREPWGQLFLAGFLLFGLVQMLEHPINRLPAPRFFLEESLELLASIYVLLGMVELVRRPADSTPDG